MLVGTSVSTPYEKVYRSVDVSAPRWKFLLYVVINPLHRVDCLGAYGYDLPSPAAG